MRKAKLKVNYNRIINNQMSDFIEGVIYGVSDNEKFTNMNSFIENIKTNHANFKKVKLKAKTGDKVARSQMKGVKETLVESLRKCANELNKQQGGNRAALISTNFNLIKDDEKTGPISVADQIEIIPQTTKGEVLIKVKFEQIIVGVLICFMAGKWDDDKKGETIFMKKKSKLIKGIMSGIVSFKIAGIGADDKIIWSDAITRSIA